MCGFSKHLKHSVVKEWIRNNNMEFGCILETRVKESKAERILNTILRDWSFTTIVKGEEFGYFGEIRFE